jgi:hypothetical protein
VIEAASGRLAQVEQANAQEMALLINTMKKQYGGRIEFDKTYAPGSREVVITVSDAEMPFYKKSGTAYDLSDELVTSFQTMGYKLVPTKKKVSTGDAISRVFAKNGYTISVAAAPDRVKGRSVVHVVGSDAQAQQAKGNLSKLLASLCSDYQGRVLFNRTAPASANYLMILNKDGAKLSTEKNTPTPALLKLLASAGFDKVPSSNKGVFEFASADALLSVKLSLASFNLQVTLAYRLKEQASVVADSQDNGIADLDSQIIEWFRTNPNPSDPDVHELAGQLGIDPEHLEKHIYRLFTQLLQQQ